MKTWTLIRHPDVVKYLYELRESGSDLRGAIKSLGDGIPEDARNLVESPETWEWPEAKHWITFIVDRERMTITISEVSSMRPKGV